MSLQRARSTECSSPQLILCPTTLFITSGESVDAREWPTAMVFKLMEEWKTSNSYQGSSISALR